MQLDDVLAGLRIIDVDTHLSEPADLWTSRAPARYRDVVPRQAERNGRMRWIVGDDIDIGGTGASSVIDRDGGKMYGVGWMKLPVDEVHDASSQVPARLAMMDRLGVHAQVMYPNVGRVRQPGVPAGAGRRAAARLRGDLQRRRRGVPGGVGPAIFPMALVPWWDIAAALDEVRRCAGMGLRGVVTCSNPEDAGLPDLAQPDWAPFFDLCQELELSINFHIGSSGREMDFYGKTPWPSHGNETRLALGSANLFLGERPRDREPHL